MVRGGRHGGRGHQGHDPCDVKNEELRRQVQQLTERLERFETKSREEDESTSNDGDENPFFHFHAPHEEPGGEGRYDQAGQFDMKVVILEFEGKIKPEVFIDWLNTVERVFDYKEMPNHRKVKLVAVKLTKNASALWEQLNIRRLRMGKSRITTWEKMKKALRGKGGARKAYFRFQGEIRDRS
ncbi:hypothetical protein ACLB2K_037909 [Fragaria x ananassa]